MAPGLLTDLDPTEFVPVPANGRRVTRRMLLAGSDRSSGPACAGHDPSDPTWP